MVALAPDIDMDTDFEDQVKRVSPRLWTLPADDGMELSVSAPAGDGMELSVSAPELMTLLLGVRDYPICAYSNLGDIIAFNEFHRVCVGFTDELLEHLGDEPLKSNVLRVLFDPVFNQQRVLGGYRRWRRHALLNLHLFRQNARQFENTDRYHALVENLGKYRDFRELWKESRDRSAQLERSMGGFGPVIIFKTAFGEVALVKKDISSELSATSVLLYGHLPTAATASSFERLRTTVDRNVAYLIRGDWKWEGLAASENYALIPARSKKSGTVDPDLNRTYNIVMKREQRHDSPTQSPPVELTPEKIAEFAERYEEMPAEEQEHLILAIQNADNKDELIDAWAAYFRRNSANVFFDGYEDQPYISQKAMKVMQAALAKVQAMPGADLDHPSPLQLAMRLLLQYGEMGIPLDRLEATIASDNGNGGLDEVIDQLREVFESIDSPAFTMEVKSIPYTLRSSQRIDISVAQLVPRV